MQSFYKLRRKIYHLILESIFHSDESTYTAVFLDDDSKKKLLDFVHTLRNEHKLFFNDNWTFVADHMTINMGPPRNKELLNQIINLEVVSYGFDQKVIAVQVKSPIEVHTGKPHITIAFNQLSGGKITHSILLNNWKPVDNFVLSGTVREVPRQRFS